MVRLAIDAARAADPGATLLVNDFDLSPAYERLIEECLDAGIRIDAIGLQTHMHQGYRGEAWMKEPCRSCPERGRDFGGCRCQAYLLTGDPDGADPVCELSPHHHLVTEAVMRAERDATDLALEEPLVFRDHRGPGGRE